MGLICDLVFLMNNLKNKKQSYLDTASVVKLKVYESFDTLNISQKKWDEFTESVGCDITLTYDWCRTWWQYYSAGRKLQIFIFRQEDNLVGIIPMFFEKIWLGPVSLRVGKIIGTDFTIATVILPILGNFRDQVVRILLSKTIGEGKCDILQIGPISGIHSDSYNLLRTLPNGASMIGYAKK